MGTPTLREALLTGAFEGCGVKPFDPALASPFHVEWLVPMDATTQDDYARAIAEKATAILRGARFVETERDESADAEVRVWVEAATAPGCVSITWEPGASAFGFHLLDETLRERLACIVFEDHPCVGAEESEDQVEQILRAALDAIRDAEGRAEASELAARVREATKSLRIPVQEGPVDPGVEP